MREPYYKSNTPALPDPSRVGAYVSRRLLGYQLRSGGLAFVWWGIVVLDSLEQAERFWVDHGGRPVYVTERPRIDRPVGDSPGWVEG